MFGSAEYRRKRERGREGGKWWLSFASSRNSRNLSVERKSATLQLNTSLL